MASTIGTRVSRSQQECAAVLRVKIQQVRGFVRALERAEFERCLAARVAVAPGATRDGARTDGADAQFEDAARRDVTVRELARDLALVAESGWGDQHARAGRRPDRGGRLGRLEDLVFEHVEVTGARP